MNRLGSIGYYHFSKLTRQPTSQTRYSKWRQRGKGHISETRNALTKLEGTSWHHAKDSVEDYINHFQELINVVEYDDDKTIAIKFHKGLNLAIQNKVVFMGDGAVDFDNLYPIPTLISDL